MTNKVIIGAVLAAAIVVSMIMTPAFAAGGYNTATSASIGYNKQKSNYAFEINSATPFLNGEGYDYGYALPTTTAGQVLVLTTHDDLGVDSAPEQGTDAAAWHLHVVTLGDQLSCNDGDPSVAGLADISGKIAFSGTGPYNVDVGQIPHSSVTLAKSDVLGFSLYKTESLDTCVHIEQDVSTTLNPHMP